MGAFTLRCQTVGAWYLGGRMLPVGDRRGTTRTSGTMARSRLLAFRMARSYSMPLGGMDEESGNERNRGAGGSAACCFSGSGAELGPACRAREPGVVGCGVAGPHCL